MAMPVDEERRRSVHSTAGTALEVGADTSFERDNRTDYMFAPKANRRPSQSRTSLKTQEKHKFTKREKIDYGGKVEDSAHR